MNAGTFRLTLASLSGIWWLALGGCAAPDSNDSTAASAPEAATTQEPRKECKADAVQYAVGQHYTPELGEKIRELSGSAVVRTLRPGQVVTMEYRFDRVSIQLDDKDVITRVSCG